LPNSFAADVKACSLLFAQFAMICISAGLAVAGAVRTSAQETRGQESIRVDVNLVTVAFSARDAHGQLVDNLTKDDFDLFEDTVPQKIAHFARSADLPLTLGLIVDASGSQEHFTKKHQRDLEVFLKDVLGPRDRVFLVGFGNHIRVVSDFSQSSADLMEEWKQYDKDSKHFSELGPKEDRDLGTAFYDSIFYSVTEKLATENGRRALLIFSDGEDNSSSHDMMTTIEAAQAANVVVFTIRYTEKEHGKLTARNQYGIRVMDRVAKETGGAHIDAESTDAHTYFRQIAEELRTSYEVGYYPSNAGKDDSFRKVVIRSKRAGVTVRSKTGYFSR
jgi:Ca-activated chloride channel family protein